MEPGIRWSEEESGRVETQVEPRRQRPGLTPLAWRAMAEPQVCGADVETGALQTWVEPVGVRRRKEPESDPDPSNEEADSQRNRWRKEPGQS